jgi:adenosine deaminase
VTLNSDDPGFFGADAADEYERSAVIHGFGRRDLLKFTQTAIDAAFCDAETKARMKATVRDAGI